MDSDTDYDNEYSDAEVDASSEEQEEFYDNDNYCSDDGNVFDDDDDTNFSENYCETDYYNDSDNEASAGNQHFQWDGDPHYSETENSWKDEKDDSDSDIDDSHNGVSQHQFEKKKIPSAQSFKLQSETIQQRKELEQRHYRELISLFYNPTLCDWDRQFYFNEMRNRQAREKMIMVQKHKQMRQEQLREQQMQQERLRKQQMKQKRRSTCLRRTERHAEPEEPHHLYQQRGQRYHCQL